MTTTEMIRRLDTMIAEQIANVEAMISEGYGETGIVNNSTATRKQVNAVFQKVMGRK